MEKSAGDKSQGIVAESAVYPGDEGEDNQAFEIVEDNPPQLASLSFNSVSFPA
jgi:hypothetical protein